MVRLAIATALVTLAAAGAPLHSQSDPEVAGCYRFSAQLFMWTVNEPWSGTVYSALSSVIELRPEPLEDPTQPRDRLRIVAPGIRDSSEMLDWYRYSHWRRVGEDSIGISWWSGLFGQSLKMRVSGDSLMGTRVYISDLDLVDRGRAVRELPTVARKIPCPTPPGG